MAEESRKPEARWEPGTLENTRKNIGSISEAEAKRMTKVLGGEIFAEKSAPIDYDSLPGAKDYKRKVVVGKVSSSATTFVNKSVTAASPLEPKKQIPTLPEIDAKERALMDRVMMNSDYKIKQNYGLFNFVKRFKKNGLETVRHDFIPFKLQNDIDHLGAFVEAVKSLIYASPETYKSKILTSNEDKFRFLKMVGNWNLKEIRDEHEKIKKLDHEATVADLIPVTKAIYKMLLRIYYLGEGRISGFFKDIYAELSKYPKIDQKPISDSSKKAIAEWFYVYSQVIKGLYPLLMRMCSKKFDYFQDFFLTQTATIFPYLGITKFDLILPTKKGEKPNPMNDEPISEEEIAEKPAEETEEEKAEKEKKQAEKARKNDYVRTGLKLLNQLFPDAGFDELASYPDMYPYFQPIYQFRDGYNLLSPFNPLQITITLLRISEDFFQGLRNVRFTVEESDAEIAAGSSSGDKVSTILNEWSIYREDLFEKFYSEAICEFVNKQYVKSDFRSSISGKRLITTMLWQTKFNFLPHFEFEQLILERPKNDSQYKPLCMRVEFMFDFLYAISKEIEAAADAKSSVVSVDNAWNRYDFGIPNPVSKRLDVLLGAKKLDDETAATNANLIKYTLYIVAVLDWWINDKSSPAYLTDSTKIYRISPEDGAPLFSVPVRDDQNKLFASKVKAAAEKAKQE